MVWAGISKRGATQIHIFRDIMDAHFYQENILRPLIPWLSAKFPDGHRFMQDNDPKHTARTTKTFMQENTINWWPTPAESPDINLIELLWKELKDFVESAKSKDELIQSILDFWAAVTPEKCQKYIVHIPKVLPIVVEKKW